ncbi:histidine kinase [Streptomyces sp. NPDC051920]|uniref:sensor histidine kinase n=1 Tax=Streptomyces sp. NPDC051920 TaxID=3155523 RepID=UPI00342607CF
MTSEEHRPPIGKETNFPDVPSPRPGHPVTGPSMTPAQASDPPSAQASAPTTGQASAPTTAQASTPAAAQASARSTAPIGRGPRLRGALAEAPSLLLSFLRGILAELAAPSAAPLPPLSRPRRLNRLPHVLVCLTALGLGLAGMDELSNGYRLGFPLGTLSGFALGAAVALALWRPVPAWWLSLGATVVAAVVARVGMIANIDGPRALSGPDWPWSTPAIMAQSVVLFLLALRSPTRVAVGALSLTALATYALQGLSGGPTRSAPNPATPAVPLGGPLYHPTGMSAVIAFSAVVVLGTALHGRRVARTQLVEQASLTEEERARRTVLEERSRIARELHDVVAHHMSVISIQAQVAPHLVENPTEELKENLAGIRQNALEALTELRRVLGVLRSENPEDPYGVGAGAGVAPDAPQPTLSRLDALVENTRAAGLDVTTEIAGEQLPLAPGVELSAYRIIQEALSNALRHAPGSAVKVELWHFPRGLQVRVVNSRPQYPAPPSPGAGHGLLGMRERVAMLGGTLVTSETSCGGFAVAAFLPGNGTAPADGAARTDDPLTGPRGEETP